jgi:hypothetical protein
MIFYSKKRLFIVKKQEKTGKNNKKSRKTKRVTPGKIQYLTLYKSMSYMTVKQQEK